MSVKMLSHPGHVVWCVSRGRTPCFASSGPIILFGLQCELLRSACTAGEQHFNFNFNLRDRDPTD